jgi:hypothetical protein
MLRLLVTANVDPSSILVPLMKEALSSSETSVLTRATWCNIPEDTILHSHYRECLKSFISNYIQLTSFTWASSLSYILFTLAFDAMDEYIF